MRKISCLIVEDQPPAQRVLRGYIAEVPDLLLLGICDTATEALAVIEQNRPDLIFLDLHLPKLFGMDFLKVLHPDVKVIITTAFADHALQSYDFNVVDYLLKPFSFDRFLKAVSKARGQSTPTNTHDDFLFVKLDKEIHKVVFDEICHVEAAKDFVYVHTLNKKLLLSQHLKHWESLLPARQFIRVHKSYIVNLNKIEKVVGNVVYLPIGEVPVGRSYRDNFLKSLGQH